MTNAIELTDLGKRYWQLSERGMLLKSVIPGRRPIKTEKWALRHIDLKVEKGETLGILGQNGAGKTTLLRVLAGVSRPSEGRAVVHGRIAPLIGVGVGFHTEMSGRENVYVNGMLLGLSKQEIDARFDEILDFAEIESFIDTPVKFYSSGMVLRLGFAIASHVNPDVLLIDEILAVGDAAFQLKCFRRVRDLQAGGTTVVLISHIMTTIRHLCPRALLVREGSIAFDGNIESAIARHYEYMTTDHMESSELAGSVSITDRKLLGTRGPTHHPVQGEELTYQARLHFGARVDSPKVQFEVTDDNGTLAYSTATGVARAWTSFEAGDSVTVEIPFLARLVGGTYRLSLSVFDRNGREPMSHDRDGLVMYLAPQLHSGGIADLRGTITVDGTPLDENDDLLIVHDDSPSRPPAGRENGEHRASD